MKKNILRILFLIAIIGSISFLINCTKAEEPLSSIEGPSSWTTPEETDPDAVVLLVQDAGPWSGGNNHIALHDMDIPHDIRNSSSLGQMTEKDFEKYKSIMYASAQSYSYYINLKDNLEKISNFVEKGGLLIAHSCDGGWDGTGGWQSFSILPGSVTHLMHWDGSQYLSQSIHILEPEHPAVKSVVKNQEFTLTDEYLGGWGYSTHGIFTNFPPDDPKVTNPKVIMESNELDNGDGPTYIDYNYGIGKVLATMQTVEWGYFNGSQGWVGNRPEFLRNELRFAKRIFPEGAKELAKEVIGKGYGYEWLPEKDIKGYRWVNKNRQFLNPPEINSLDCSGLSFWSYNRAYYGDREIEPSYAIWEETPREKWKENLWEIKWENRPLYYFGANGQWEGNAKPLAEEWRHLETRSEDEINGIVEEMKEMVEPGDLLFFDTGRKGEGIKDHVAMYTERVEKYVDAFVEYDYMIVHAHNDTPEAGISEDTIDNLIRTYWQWAKEKSHGFKGLSIGAGRVKDHIVDMKIVGGSPIDLIITDPEGIILTKELDEVPGMSYMEYDIDGDGELNEIVAMPIRKIGNYSIQIVPEPDALPTDTYNLEITAAGITIVLAENVPISEIPRTLYIIKSTETEITPIISAFVDFDQDTLNLKSKGKYATVYIELPIGYDITEVDLETIKLNNQVPAESRPTQISDYDNNGISDLMVKFNRSTIQNILEVGDEVKITITGELIDGSPFQGSDTIRVISK